MHIPLNRTFKATSKENESSEVILPDIYDSKAEYVWKDLLAHQRAVVLAEAGMGKTEELKAKTLELIKVGNFSFFCRLENLIDSHIDFDLSIDIGREKYNDWFNSSEHAYFFLDSVDEARLERYTDFERALRNFAQALKGKLNRVNILLSSRVSDWRATADLDTFKRNCPLSNSHNAAEEFKVYNMAKLNEERITSFLDGLGTENTTQLLVNIKRADLLNYAGRPQDLLDLVAFWKANSCKLGSHYEMLKFNISEKLNELNPNHEIKVIASKEEKESGVKRLAAALTLNKKNMIIIPEIDVDSKRRELSINVNDVLPEWSPPKKALNILHSALFDDAIYGTVRFHHRSIREFLTAEWVLDLINSGTARREIDSLFFNTKYGEHVLIQSMGPVLAWLSLINDDLKMKASEICPEVLINFGDPASFPVNFRKSLLKKIFAKYSNKKHTTGLQFEGAMLKKLASPDLCPVINEFLEKHFRSYDLFTLLLDIIEWGSLEGCCKTLVSIYEQFKETDLHLSKVIRIIGHLGDELQKRSVIESTLHHYDSLDEYEIKQLLDLYFPTIMSLEELILILAKIEPPKQRTLSRLSDSLIESIEEKKLDNEKLIILLEGLTNLILRGDDPIKEGNYTYSSRYSCFLSLIIFILSKLIKNKETSFYRDDVFYTFCAYLDRRNDSYNLRERDKESLEAMQNSHEFRYRLFKFKISEAKEKNDTRITHWYQFDQDCSTYIYPALDNWHSLIRDLEEGSPFDQKIIFSMLVSTLSDNQNPEYLVNDLQEKLIEKPDIKKELQKYLNPSSEILEKRREYQLQQKKFEQERKERDEKVSSNERRLISKINSLGARVRKLADFKEKIIFDYAKYLYQTIAKTDNNGNYGKSNWEILIPAFSLEIAEAFRDGCIDYWRVCDPEVHNNSLSTCLALSGFAMELKLKGNYKHLTENESNHAIKFITSILDDNQSLFRFLHLKYFQLAKAKVIALLDNELSEKNQSRISYTLQSLRRTDEASFYVEYFLPKILNSDINSNVFNLTYMIEIILDKGSNIHIKALTDHSENLAFPDLKNERNMLWLSVLMSANGGRGVKCLKNWLKRYKHRKADVISELSAHLCGRSIGFNYKKQDYLRVDVLQEFIEIVYSALRFEEDTDRAGKGIYTPNARDEAQRFRSSLFTDLFNISGYEAYKTFKKLGELYPNSYFRDNCLIHAKKVAEQDSEKTYTLKEVVSISKKIEATPKTESDLFSMTVNRLDDLKFDLEEGDESEAQLWQRMNHENEFRVVIANRLRKHSLGHYTIDSENENAEGKRTDIRLSNSFLSHTSVPIELKIAKKSWSGDKLLERIENQLLGQYMKVSNTGIFLIVSKGDKKRWIIKRKSHTFSELICTLQKSAENIVDSSKRIKVIGIDLLKRGVVAS